jgi:hypothetical protein
MEIEKQKPNQRLTVFHALNATAEVHPAMTADDLAKAGRAIEQAAKKYAT